jgi:hypothetical protein
MFEVERIEEVINEASPLFSSCQTKDPDFIVKSASAMIMHSFYNGIENIMLLIVKKMDSNLPDGTQWHKKLLARALNKTENRTPIFREELKEPLDEYLRFRHIVRHLYGPQLKWEDMKNLFLDMNMIWKIVKEDLNIFIESN